MSNTTPAQAGLGSRIWHWLRALETAVESDPSEALRRRIDRLEAQVERLEADHGAGPLLGGACGVEVGHGQFGLTVGAGQGVVSVRAYGVLLCRVNAWPLP